MFRGNSKVPLQHAEMPNYVFCARLCTLLSKLRQGCFHFQYLLRWFYIMLSKMMRCNLTKCRLRLYPLSRDINGVLRKQSWHSKIPFTLMSYSLSTGTKWLHLCKVLSPQWAAVVEVACVVHYLEGSSFEAPPLSMLKCH